MKLWNRRTYVAPWMRIPDGYLTTGTIWYQERMQSFWQVMIPTPIFDWEYSIERMQWVIGYKWFTIRHTRGKSVSDLNVINVRYGEPV